MDNISVVCDHFYAKTAMTHLLKDKYPNVRMTEELVIHTFERTWLSKDELLTLLGHGSKRVLVFARKELLTFLSTLNIPSTISFAQYEVSMGEIKNELVLFINNRNKAKGHKNRAGHDFCVLSPNEKYITSLYVRGLSMHDISIMLNKNFKTISAHKRSAMRKMGITTDIELMQKGEIILLTDKANALTLV
jgi:DNA-binding CsgD family transcriptional regulator